MLHGVNTHSGGSALERVMCLEHNGLRWDKRWISTSHVLCIKLVAFHGNMEQGPLASEFPELQTLQFIRA